MITATQNYTVEMIPTSEIIPAHEVRDHAKLTAICESMCADGWQGRPLLVVRVNGEYQALTGSHRYAAAVSCELETLPCVVISYREVKPTGYKMASLRDQETAPAVLRAIGNTEAIALMEEEIRHNQEEN